MSDLFIFLFLCCLGFFFVAAIIAAPFVLIIVGIKVLGNLFLDFCYMRSQVLKEKDKEKIIEIENYNKVIDDYEEWKEEQARIARKKELESRTTW